MPTNILMPALSPTMEKGNLARWLKKEGDKIKSGDIIAEIETDKATMEYEAVDEGTLAKIVVPEGTQDVAVNAVIAVLAAEGEDVMAAASGAKSAPAAKPAASSLETPAKRAPQGEAKKALQPAPEPTPRPEEARSAVSKDAGPRAAASNRIFSSPRAPPGEGRERRPQPRAGFRPAWPRYRARYQRGEIRHGLALAQRRTRSHADGGLALRRADPGAVRRRLLRFRPARQHTQNHRAAAHAVEADHSAFLSHARLRYRQAATRARGDQCRSSSQGR